VTSVGPPPWLPVGDVETDGAGRVHVVDVNFNSLDVIANQDTVVELASFFQRLLPANSFRKVRNRYALFS